MDVAVKSDTGFFVGLAEDVSERGLFVVTVRSIPVGGEVALALALPRGDVLTRGRVRWARSPEEGQVPGVGIEFDAMPAEDKERIEAYCAERRSTK